jgi:HPt (histidine-containing phosphotransfer) domain-containing protein
VQAALEEIPCLMGAIRQTIHDGDAAALRLKSHTLKGSIRYFGSGPAYQRAFELEELGRNGKLEEAERLLPILEQEIGRLVPALSEYLDREETTD